MRYGYDGVKFYSKNDMSVWIFLSKAESILKTFDASKEYEDINQVLELFNVQLLMDIDTVLSSWSDDEYNHYKAIAKKFTKTIAVFLNSLIFPASRSKC